MDETMKRIFSGNSKASEEMRELVLKALSGNYSQQDIDALELKRQKELDEINQKFHNRECVPATESYIISSNDLLNDKQ